MPHDKIRAAARKRMIQTGEPYAAARRAVVTEHHGWDQSLSPDTGYVLRMSAEIRDWLADLRDSNPRAAMRVTQTLAALMEEGAGLGDPLVVSTAAAWPEALVRSVDHSYPQSLERMTVVRRAVAAAATLVKDIQDQSAELESATARLEDQYRHAMDADRLQEAAQTASQLDAAQQQAAELQRLLPTVIASRDRLVKVSGRLQARIDAYRTRREVLKATYAAAQGALRVHQTIAASGLSGDIQQEDAGEAIKAAQAQLADVTARMELELGKPSWPEGLMELRPGAPVHSDIRILFAAEPPAIAVLIAVLDGPDVVEEQFPDAVMASADMLRHVRAGQVPEAVAYRYDTPESFLEEFSTGNTDEASTKPTTPRDTPGTRD